MLRADTALRAVPVPAGERRVELRYRPCSFRAGLAAASVAAAAFVLAIACERRLNLRSGSR